MVHALDKQSFFSISLFTKAASILAEYPESCLGEGALDAVAALTDNHILHWVKAAWLVRANFDHCLLPSASPARTAAVEPLIVHREAHVGGTFERVTGPHLRGAQ